MWILILAVLGISCVTLHKYVSFSIFIWKRMTNIILFLRFYESDYFRTSLSCYYDYILSKCLKNWRRASSLVIVLLWKLLCLFSEAYTYVLGLNGVLFVLLVDCFCFLTWKLRELDEMALRFFLWLQGYVFFTSVFSWLYIEDSNKYYGFTKEGCIVIGLSPMLTTL